MYSDQDIRRLILLRKALDSGWQISQVAPLSDEELEQRLAAQPVINVPTITLDGDSDGVIPATDGAAHAAKFSNRIAHRVITRAGHNLPQEAPEAFAAAVMELLR